jgi:type IV pilus assembly protein PilB
MKVNKKKRKLGEILIEAGLLTAEQLENALNLQKGKNKRLGKILLELGYADESKVAQTLAEQLDIPLVVCKQHSPTKNILLQVPKDIAEEKIILPLRIKDRTMLLAMANPLDWRTIDDISFKSGLKLDVAIACESDILQSIEELYGTSQYTWDILNEIPSYEEAEFVKEEVIDDEKQTISVQSLFKESEAPPIVKLVTMLIADAVNADASDIHIEPRDGHVQVRYRMDGELHSIHNYSKHIHNSVISRIKIISNLDITKRRLPQDGRSSLRLKDKTVDLRISTLPSVNGEKVVIRLLDPTTGLIPLSQLGIDDSIIKPLINIISQPQGMLLVTGPTGSGKTTTLYSIIQQLRNETKNIITLEEPVEYKLRGITQVAIHENIGLSFSHALRSVLRQDPDIIMVGEVRDLDTAEIAARSALTGHFVLSTLHTNDTVSSITRLLDIGLEHFLVTAAVNGILAQRLVRKICPDCKREVPAPYEVETLQLKPLNAYYKGEGCNKCSYTGFKGRIGIYELLTLNSELNHLITKDISEDDIWQCAKESGTIPLFEDAWAKVEAGITTVDEVISRIPQRHVSIPVKKRAVRKKKTKKVIALK